MSGDVWTIIWRDLRAYRAQFDDPRRIALGALASVLILILLEFAIGVQDEISRAHPILLIWIWCWLPLGSAVTLSTDAVAGERERHTLESLLATRLPMRALLMGKALSVTLQSWFSALLLAAGALAALNLATAWRGEFVLFPLSVLIIGPILSFFLTLLGTLAALLFSMDAPTVRQANFRIIIVTSVLPVILLVPLMVLLLIAAVAFAFVVQFTGLGINRNTFAINDLVIAAALGVVLVGFTIAIAATYLATALRFTRERLLRASAKAGKSEADRIEPFSPPHVVPHFAFAHDIQASSAVDTRYATTATRPLGRGWMSVLADARIVAWKELNEAKGLLREWRGWLFVIGFVLASMVVQLSAIGSWYWAQDADTSLLFWLAMAAAMPLLIAQRSADAIAGERERHTGEILFTTRLSHAGILIGKLSVTALLPWAVLLVIPAIGLLATNLVHASNGPYFYPPDVLVAGLGLTLGVAFTFSSAGMLVSLGAPTVQHAARRISWFLMPILIAPGLVLRSSVLSSGSGSGASLETSGIVEFAASGRLTVYALALMPLLALVSATLVYFLHSRFRRGTTVFD